MTRNVSNRPSKTRRRSKRHTRALIKRKCGVRRTQKGGANAKRQIWGKVSTSDQLNQHVYLTYGTISNAGIDKFLEDVRPPLDANDVFFDLGSGVGNVCDRVFARTNVRKCVGIEYDHDRYAVSSALSRHGQRQVTFIQGNFMDQDWSDATVLFMDSIMFSNDTLQQIEYKALATCPRLRYVISMKRLPSTTALHFLKTIDVKVSWGVSTCNLYRVAPASGGRNPSTLARTCKNGHSVVTH